MHYAKTLGMETKTSSRAFREWKRFALKFIKGLFQGHLGSYVLFQNDLKNLLWHIQNFNRCLLMHLCYASHRILNAETHWMMDSNQLLLTFACLLWLFFYTICKAVLNEIIAEMVFIFYFVEFPPKYFRFSLSVIHFAHHVVFLSCWRPSMVY